MAAYSISVLSYAALIRARAEGERKAYAERLAKRSRILRTARDQVKRHPGLLEELSKPELRLLLQMREQVLKREAVK